MPFKAPLGPPLTGASTKLIPFFDKIFSILRVIFGSPVVISIIDAPFFKCLANPLSPKIKLSTISLVGRHKKIKSL